MKNDKDVPNTARLVRHGAYQYVRLPKGFEFEGDKVRISRQGATVVLEPSELVIQPAARKETASRSK